MHKSIVIKAGRNKKNLYMKRFSQRQRKKEIVRNSKSKWPRIELSEKEILVEEC